VEFIFFLSLQRVAQIGQPQALLEKIEECEGKSVGTMVSGHFQLESCQLYKVADRHAVMWHHLSTYHLETFVETQRAPFELIVTWHLESRRAFQSQNAFSGDTRSNLAEITFADSGFVCIDLKTITPCIGCRCLCTHAMRVM
jgi:hypothetical protein